MREIIEIKNINKSFDGRKVIDNLSINIQDNSFVAIMGSSGSGKSTLLNIASGLLKPTSGNVFINEREITSLKEPRLTKYRAKNVGFIFQDYSLIEYLNVLENIKYTSKMANQKIDKQLLRKVIHKVGLETHLKKLPSKLSGGEKQRVAIARSLISNSKIIFADEPTGALDLATRGDVLSLLKEAKEEFGKTIVMVTHDPEAASYADEVLFLTKGKFKIKLQNASPKAISNKLIELEREDV